ncbi:MAG: bifunctional folylpolyglutamate synthase/dihydrofolate synthase [Butyrivibrio sp.]|nr:bifunctional folylpolyglutamate synthase/dihydrofolate synthase [Butyrivibrio sp.]
MREETDYIYGIPRFAGKAPLENTAELIRRLGAECAGARIIHVAGTNGKGSVCAFLDGVLRRAGFRVGMFTSPHLVRINERIAVDGAQVSDSEFEKSFARVRSVSEAMVSDGFAHPSFFEFLFGMAMDIFSSRGLDCIILETGLGGRLDATNIFERPSLTVITSIGLDHTEYLGSTYAEIASEKAGIIKAGVPVVFEKLREDVTDVLTRRAAKLGAPVYVLEPSQIKDIRVQDKKIDFLLCNGYYCNERFTVRSAAEYQAENASLAATAAAVFGITDKAAVKSGIASVFWKGRMQETDIGITVDGAHNADGIRRFIESVGADGAARRALLFSAVRDKHYADMVSELCRSGLFAVFILARLEDARGLELETMQGCFERYTDCPVKAYADTGSACNAAREYIDAGFKVYSAGSLYLAGEILSGLE